MPNAIFFYRIERWLYLHRCGFLAKVIQQLIFIIYNTKVSGKAKIGKGTVFVCSGVSCVIHDKTEIGKNCRIGLHFVVVGQGPYKNVAKIGDNVWIGPNVTMQGPVMVGNGAVIAPGTVVNYSVPEKAIVAGVPAKIIGFTNELGYDIMALSSTKDGWKPYLADKRTKH